jgi:cytochrome oxidase Cu insertion factor (SCO1/SenC/PrrC family)
MKPVKAPFLISMVLIVVIGIFLYNKIADSSGEPREIPVIQQVPSFSLINQNGEVVALQLLRDTYWIANFIFTSCAGTCPVMTFQMGELQGAIEPTLPVRFVSFSVDPERDTPEVLFEYGERNGADHSRWFFLTGNRDEIYSLARSGFLLSVDADGGNASEPILHSQRFVLVDTEGFIRGYYNGFDDTEIEELRLDIEYLLSNM